MKAWVAAAKSAARASMVNQVAASRVEGVYFCSHSLPGSYYCWWLGFSLPGACSAIIGVRTQPLLPLLGRSECCQCAKLLQSA